MSLEGDQSPSSSGLLLSPSPVSSAQSPGDQPSASPSPQGLLQVRTQDNNIHVYNLESQVKVLSRFPIVKIKLRHLKEQSAIVELELMLVLRC